MVAEFVATEASVGEEEHFIVVWAGCLSARPPRYVNFQRSIPAGGDDDDGVYFEFDDQINSGYEKVRRCSLARGRLRVELTEPIDPRKQYTALEVELRVSDSDRESVTAGLRQVFAGRGGVLDVE